MTPDKDQESEALSEEFRAFDAMVRQVAKADPKKVKEAVEAENAVPKKRGRPPKKRKHTSA